MFADWNLLQVYPKATFGHTSVLWFVMLFYLWSSTLSIYRVFEIFGGIVFVSFLSFGCMSIQRVGLTPTINFAANYFAVNFHGSYEQTNWGHDLKSAALKLLLRNERNLHLQSIWIYFLFCPFCLRSAEHAELKAFGSCLPYFRANSVGHLEYVQCPMEQV